MSISRDEARELAIVGLLLTAALRMGAGVFQAIEEMTGAWTFGSMLDRFFAPAGGTLGFATLGAVLLVVLSPSGSVRPWAITVCRRFAVVATAIGIGASIHTLGFGLAPTLTRIWFSMINGLAATALAGTAFLIIRNFDPER